MKPVNMTRTIQSMALSNPRLFASRATHTSKAMLRAITATTTNAIIPIPAPQAAHPAAASASPPHVGPHQLMEKPAKIFEELVVNVIYA